jgi:hypothetical protein
VADSEVWSLSRPAVTELASESEAREDAQPVGLPTQ